MLLCISVLAHLLQIEGDA